MRIPPSPAAESVRKWRRRIARSIPRLHLSGATLRVFLPILEGDAGHLEEVGGAGVPAGAVHAADEIQAGRIDVKLVGVQNGFVADVHREDAAEDQTRFRAQVDDL